MSRKNVGSLVASLLALSNLPCQAGAVKAPAGAKKVPAPQAASPASSEWMASKKAGDLAIISGDSGAEAKYSAALSLAEKAKDNKALLVCLSALANCLASNRGRIADEEPLRQSALDLAQKTCGTASPQYAATLAAMSDYLARRGDIGQAEEKSEKAMAILGQSEDKFPLEMATCYQAVAERQIAVGTPGLADGSIKKALELREAKLPANDVLVLLTCRRYSELLKQLGRKDEASKLDERIALARAEAPTSTASVASSPKAAAKPDKNKDVFLKLLSDAKEADKSGDSAKSLACWKLVVQEAEKASPADARLPYALVHLADACAGQKQKDEASALYKRALDMREKMGATNTLGAVRNLSRMAGMVLQNKNAAEADKLYSKALAIEDQLSAPDLIQAITLQNLLSTGMMTNDNGKVEQVAKRLMTVADKLGGAFGGMQKRSALAMLGMVYMKSGRLNEGMNLMKSMPQSDRLNNDEVTKAVKEAYATDETLVDKAEEASFIN